MSNPPDGFDIYLVNVKTIRTIAHIFVVFSEKLNFINMNMIKNHECEIIAFICSGKNRVEVYGGVTGVFTSSGFGVSLWESAEKCIG